MATKQEFVDFVLSQIENAGEVEAKKMFGEYGLYVNGKLVGLFCDDRLFIKPTIAGRDYIRNVVELPPYDGAKPSFLIEDRIEEQEMAKDNPEQLFRGHDAPSAKDEQQIRLQFMELSEHVVEDYATTGLSVKAHPVSFVRTQLDWFHITACTALSATQNGDYIKVAGLVLVCQRPGTAKGVLFMTIEDETGTANAVIWESRFEEFRKEILTSRLILLEGRLQIEGLVVHVVVEKCYNVSSFLRNLTPSHTDEPAVLTLSRADERSVPAHVQRTEEKNRDSVFYKGRNFK